MWTLHSGLPHTFSIFGYGKLIYFLWFISIINLAAVKTASDVQGRKEAMYSVDATQRKGEERESINDGDKNDGRVLVFGAGS